MRYNKYMENNHYSITIGAPKQKVWETMLNDATYREWTAVFNPSGGSYYEGDWSQGSDIRFLGADEGGTVSGMISKIKESRPYEFVSIQHIGEIIKGEEKIYPGQSQGFENYTFNEVEGGTEVVVELIDLPYEYKEMFDDMWPKALEKLKELAER